MVSPAAARSAEREHGRLGETAARQRGEREQLREIRLILSLHVIAEVRDARALSRAMRGLAIRLARRLNGRLKHRGAVFAERYNARALRTPLEVRRALIDVFHNHRHHHSGAGRPCFLDPMSTAPYFDGFTFRPRWPRHGFIPPQGTSGRVTEYLAAARRLETARCAGYSRLADVVDGTRSSDH